MCQRWLDSSQLGFNTYFENVIFFQYNWYIRNNVNITQISNLLMSDFSHKKQKVNAEKCTQLNWAM